MIAIDHNQLAIRMTHPAWHACSLHDMYNNMITQLGIYSARVLTLDVLSHWDIYNIGAWL